MNASRPKRILLTTDFSKGASGAYRVALALARLHGSSIDLIHVIEGPVVEGEEPPDPLSSIVTHEREVSDELDALDLGEITDLEVIRQVVLAPSVAEGVARFAREHENDLVVIASHGRRPIGQLILGSVTRRVVESVPIPVLCVKLSETEPEPAGAFRHLLVPTDFSEASREAYRVALDVAEPIAARVTLLHVIPIVVAPTEFAYEVPPSAYLVDQEMRQRLGDALSELGGEASARSISIETVLLDGLPSRTIATVAKDSECDLIVMNRKGLEHTPFFLGGVTERMLHEAPCPLLIV